MSVGDFAFFLACVAVAGYVQNLTGFAFGLVLLGLTGVAHVGSIADVANVVSVLALVNAATWFHASRPQIDASLIKPTLAASLAGVVLGAWLLGWLSDNILVGLRLLLGLTIIGCALVLVMPAGALKQRSSTGSFAAFGLLGGLLGGLFSTAGPPLVFHFYRQPLPQRLVRDSLILIFAINGIVRLALLLADGRVALDVLWLSLLALPAVMLQTRWMARRPPRWHAAAIKRIVAALLVLIGAGLAGPAGRALLA